MRKPAVTAITRIAAVLATAASMLTLGLAMAPVVSADTASTIQSTVQGRVGAQAHGRLSVASAATVKSPNGGPRNDPQGTVTQAQARAIAAASTAAISRSEMESRARYWVSQNIPYSQSSYLGREFSAHRAISPGLFWIHLDGVGPQFIAKYADVAAGKSTTAKLLRSSTWRHSRLQQHHPPC